MSHRDHSGGFESIPLGDRGQMHDLKSMSFADGLGTCCCRCRGVMQHGQARGGRRTRGRPAASPGTPRPRPSPASSPGAGHRFRRDDRATHRFRNPCMTCHMYHFHGRYSHVCERAGRGRGGPSPREPVPGRTYPDAGALPNPPSTLIHEPPYGFRFKYSKLYTQTSLIPMAGIARLRASGLRPRRVFSPEGPSPDAPIRMLALRRTNRSTLSLILHMDSKL
jgi:hypothetical protein